MKKISFLSINSFAQIIVLFGYSLSVHAQTLTVRVSPAGAPEAVVGLEGTPFGGFADSTGTYRFTGLKPGRYHLRIQKSGFYPYRKLVVFSADQTLAADLLPREAWAEEVLVKATRSKPQGPTTSSQVEREEIEKLNLGQDLPILLQQATSVLSSSDAGAGVGYTGISIRGSDATRINVTLNGVPLNDAESHGLFWVNMPDFASSVQNIQIQRGVGTSTNGSAAFGASLNIQTQSPRPDAWIESNVSGGSFNTRKANLMVGTGNLDGWSAEARISRIASDGFIDRGSADLESRYFSGGYTGKKTSVRLVLLDGEEKTYQAWNGIPEARLRGDRQGMLDFAARNFLSESDTRHLLESGSRTYNQFRYRNQTDNYRQTHYQLFFTHELNRNWLANAALHYTRGAGYFEEFKTGQEFDDYGLPLFLPDSRIQTTDLIRQRWLDNHFFGSTYSLLYQGKGWDLTIGGSASQYRGDHFGKVIWAQVSGLADNTFRYYDNDATKSDLTHYAKATYTLNRKWSVYGDLQHRFIDYRFAGFDQNLNPTDQTAQFHFFNPKAGVSFKPHARHNLYASYGKSSREPVRDDFINSTPQSRPNAEILHNVELGWRTQYERWQATVNAYYMYYPNQLILTGEINDVGAYIRSNVKNSFRSGIEMEGRCRILPVLQLAGNLTLARNQIREFVAFTDDYDQNNQQREVFRNTPIAFSPNLISALELTWFARSNVEMALIGKAVGRQYLDNTGNRNRSLDPYQFLNFRASWKWLGASLLGKKQEGRELRFQVLVNNLLNQTYETNGYTFGYIAGGARVQENFFFPQAGRNFLAGLSLRL